ncbi:MAG: large conductance mechanosensitive channel protein MscL [Clostridiales bacterium]|nr:large conductance mechanosensitive channel protein MscL [Clostridiales bacterium]
MRKFFGEFKKFITRGNVFDLAVGMIIATAFNKIVSSLVNDIIMPLVTWTTGAASLKDLSLPLRYTVDPVTGLEVVSLSWAYGNFLQTVIDFLIIAFSVFIMVKVVNTSRDKLMELNSLAMKQTNKEYRTEKKLIKEKAKSENRKFKEVWKEHLDEKAKNLEEKRLAKEKEEKEKAEAHAKENPTSETLLKEIRDLLKEDKKKK